MSLLKLQDKECIDYKDNLNSKKISKRLQRNNIIQKCILFQCNFERNTKRQKL